MFDKRFFRIAALCSFVSAITTLCLIFLPRLYSPPATFEQNLQLVDNTWYTLRLWIYFAHPFFVVAAALGVAVAKFRNRAASVVPGFLFFFVWAFTEMLQQAVSLVANHYAWRAGYAAADATTRAALHSSMIGFDAVWDALYALLLVGFTLGSALYSVAFWTPSRLERALSLAFAAAAALSVFNFVAVFGINHGADPVLSILYPLIQPAARAALGVWLWRESTRA